MSTLRIATALVASLALPLSIPAVAAAAPGGDEQLTDKQKVKKAKTLYAEAEAKAKAGDWAEAADLYEQAYYLVPGKHGFAFKVGVAAFEAGDCDRAQDYLIHFLTYGDHEKHQDKLDEAQRLLEDIDESGCASEKSAMQVDAEGNAVDVDDPFAAGNDDADDDERGVGDKGLLAGSAVMLALGAGGMVVGGVGAAMAGGTARDLEALGGEELDTPTGYATGYYSCKGSATCPQDLEQQFRTDKTVMTVGFVTGSVLLAGGAALLAVYLLKDRDGDDGREARRSRPHLTAVGPTLTPRGAGFGAALRF